MSEKMNFRIPRGIVATLLFAGSGVGLAAEQVMTNYACSVTVEDGSRTVLVIQTNSPERARTVALRNLAPGIKGDDLPVRQVHECVAPLLGEHFSNPEDQRNFEQQER